MVFAAIVMAITSVLLASVAVLADGLPSPLPGAVSGPSTQTIQDIATAYGLTCQASSAPGGAPESFCLRVDPSGLRLSATYYENPTLVLQATVSGSPPFPAEADEFLNAITAPFCSPDDAVALADAIQKAKSTTTTAALETKFCSISAAYRRFLQTPLRS